MKFFIKTYGCQMNVRDSESASTLLTRHGHTRAATEKTAEVVIVNTCSVRAKAEDKAIGKLRMLVSERDEYNGRLVGVIGCMVQRLKIAILDEVPGLDFAVGTHSLARLPLVLERAADRTDTIIETGEDDDDQDELCGHDSGNVTAFVNILLGCDRHCTYCVVPSVRGRERSRSADSIIDEVRKLVADGTQEVILLGQSVMSYGRKGRAWPDAPVSRLGFKEPFALLLEALNEIAGLDRVRFTSGHPSGCTEELVRAMSELRVVCEHLHLPMQSGSNRILKMMGRGYTTDDYLRAADRLRAGVANMALTTDVIVGFPTETVEDFDMTRNLMEKIGFDSSFIFKYSPRPDTAAAARWQDDVHAEEKMRRNKALLADQATRALAINSLLAGDTVSVLVEGTSRRNASRLSGRTRTNKTVVFDPIPGVSVGDIITTTIERATAQTLYGRMIDRDR